MDTNQTVSLIMMNQGDFLSDRFGNRSREKAAKHYLRKQREMRMRSDRANALRQDIRYLPEIGEPGGCRGTVTRVSVSADLCYLTE